VPLPASPYPKCLVEFGGVAVPPDAVRSLTLETNVEYQADSLELVLDNAAAYSDGIAKETPLEVHLGYVRHPLDWHTDELTHVFSGAADGVLPTWGDDMTLTIRARDHTRRLIDEQADPGWPWLNMTDADVVARLAERAGLRADIAPAAGMLPIEETLSLPGGWDMYNLPVVAPTAWDIIQRLAVRNGYIAVVTVDKRLYFGPRGGLGAVPILGGVLGAAGGSIGTWTYFDAPHDLLAAEFDDSALVVNKVTVVKWLGLDGGGFVGGSAVDDGRLKAARGRVIEKTIVSATAKDQAGCETEARARLAELARAAITATATVEGDPRLVGDAKITLAGGKLGRFRGDYYVAAARHRFGTDGYTTELQLSSVRPEASEVYRPTLSGEPMSPDEAAGAAAAVAQSPVCGDAPVDWAAEWPEFGGPVAQLLLDNGITQAIAKEDSTCGPIAAAGMLKAFKISTDPGKLAARAYQGGGPTDRWWTGGGMAGPDSEVNLIASQLLPAKNLGRDIQEAIRRCSRCEPVIFDTAGAGDGRNVGHYILASAYRESDGRFFGGVTISNAMKRSGGNPWASVAEIESYGLGAIRSVIVADVAAAPAQRAADVTNLPPMQVDGRSHQAFVDSSKPLAYAWEKQTGIPAVVFMAISASESNWGGAAKPPTVMLFGIGADAAHPSVTFSDNPYMAFRAYPTANDAYKDFADLVTQGRYATAYARVKAGGSGEQFVADLQLAGYAGHHNASDEDWTNIITSLMRQVQALL
jgi:phage protein D